MLVPADSRYRDIADLIAAWRADPGGVAIGGGSAVGGPDHLMTMQLAQAVGIDPRQVRYGTFDGGGALLPALLDDRIDVAVSSLVEYTEQVRSGQLRVLAVSGPNRVAGIDAPTLTEIRGRRRVHQLARRARAARASPTPTGRALVDLFARARTDPGMAPGAGREQLDAARFWPGTTSTTFLQRRGSAGPRHPGGAGPGLTVGREVGRSRGQPVRSNWTGLVRPVDRRARAWRRDPPAKSRFLGCQ